MPEWLDWAEAAQELGVTVAKVRTMIRDHELAAAVPSPGAGQQIPAELHPGRPRGQGPARAADVLHDGGYDDREMHRLAVHRPRPPGRPIDALRENRGSEVKRRAQAMAF